MPTTKKKFCLKYRYNIFWLIFWLVIFFPVGLVLWGTGMYVIVDGTTYEMRYDGSRGWLAFWTLVFFPVAIILLVVNGINLETTKPRKRAAVKKK